jgi:hypothetical protein
MFLRIKISLKGFMRSEVIARRVHNNDTAQPSLKIIQGKWWPNWFRKKPPKQ